MQFLQTKSLRLSSVILTLLIILSCSGNGNNPYDMSNTANPGPNLMTGGQPSIDDLNKMAKEGVKTIVNLRTKGEFKQFDEKLVVENLGMKYVLIEVDGSDGITLENTELLDSILNEGQNTLVHCASSNRVGGLLAYRAFRLQGRSTAEALAFGKKAGMRSTEKKVRQLMESDK